MATKTDKKTATKKTTTVVKKTEAKPPVKKTTAKKTTAKKVGGKKVNQMTFDPSKAYKWSPDQQFVLNGRAFSEVFMFLTLSRNLLPILEKSYQSLVEVIQTGINDGYITEFEQNDGLKK